jgi:predicted metal-dependent phosphoesterase TrpH
MLVCDLHIHTTASRDGESDVGEILRIAAERGLDAIAITDHDTVEASRRAAEMGSPVLVIPGIEVSTLQGHLIVLGVTETIPRGLSFTESVSMARKMGGVVVLPHPFHIWRHGAARRQKDALNLVDAVEVFNSRYITGSANKKAAYVARKLKKPMVAGSDAHNARYVGYGRTMIDADNDVASILEAIRSGRTSPGGRKTPIKTYTRQSIRNTWKRVKRKVLHR